VTGPGGFTSLRVAVTLANVYSDQLNIPVAGVHLSDLYWVRTSHSLNPSPEGRGTFIWMHSTKKTQLFVRSFGDQPWSEPTLVSIDELLAQLPEDASIVGEVLPEHREVIAHKHPTYPSITDIADVLPSFLSAQIYDRTPILPWYGRGW
jgi:tRNA A37 threonylcarbamoyladenosine modification protein TsaB